MKKFLIMAALTAAVLVGTRLYAEPGFEGMVNTSLYQFQAQQFHAPSQALDAYKNTATVADAQMSPIDTIVRAIKVGNIGAATYLIRQYSADINTLGSDGCTALTWAVRLHETEIVNLLLEVGSNVNMQNKNGFTPISVAAYVADANIAKLLLSKGADVTINAEQDWTPLMSAVEGGSVEIAKMLIDKGVDVNTRNTIGEPDEPGQTALLIEYRKEGADKTDFPIGHIPTYDMFMLLMDHGAEF